MPRAAPTKAYGATGPDAALAPLTIERRALSAGDVAIDIDYCGVCHSDIHHTRGDWGPVPYPAVPGHEIVGTVREVGADVTKFKAGDRVGVGCMVSSCLRCQPCLDHEEMYCEQGMVLTYGSEDPFGEGHTHGGYSGAITVREEFVLRMPDGLDAAKAAPLLCAGITTYSPLAHWNVGEGDVVGVIGLGGLGHMGVKFAHAMGAHVVMLTTSPEKASDAERLGADEVLVTTDRAAMKAAKGRFDFLLNTVPVAHDLNGYLQLLNRDGAMVIVGAIDSFDGVQSRFLFGRKRLSGSAIGGIEETQEMLDFCADHDILPDVEMIGMEGINEAWERVVRGDVHYRFVIDMQSLKAG